MGSSERKRTIPTHSATENTIVWFRRDLRLVDLPTLLAAADSARNALAVFVLDPALIKPSGVRRRTALIACLNSLDEALDGRLLVVRGNPVEIIPDLARRIEATQVHISSDHGPYGTRRDAAVEQHIPLVRTGSPFAIAPGRIVKDDGTAYRVFTPFYKRWLDHGWRAPASTSASTNSWIDPAAVTGVERAELPANVKPVCPVGEHAAREQWDEYLANGVDQYKEHRDRPDLDDTTRMSVHLKWGTIHPRTMLADLRDHDSDSARELRRQLAWRDFYADVLAREPRSARHNLNPDFDRMPISTDTPEAQVLLAAWKAGRTGYPIVDAGMRQLLHEGWMHNRVRMIVASFLVKDLHLPWWWGARFFMRHLVDGDLPANQHGWQWVAGSGTDAAPYFRIFNPITQGQRYDPQGDYVRRWVPELREIPGKEVHTVGQRGIEVPGYPAPIVDHAVERREALARYEHVKQAR
ncbi:deoxyribodipyrimidine photo-lyase [Hoyosella sp. G463]|uniref:Deoxyribodipyrimidine photo-lyase n=1 Tax=Lolliginicoccus lacisalsi TaxID=2742202 RepID=A0A927PKA5_9ACTN|nr:deoxyribodipyrimidine photo-lyase [Lolliginicoccus lacisalsi]MBD8505805.1 deoxyribodipyrimidine photo-lyase [Lolliginicoccus lacisalsi]